jgi:hypothetical protein
VRVRSQRPRMPSRVCWASQKVPSIVKLSRYAAKLGPSFRSAPPRSCWEYTDPAVLSPQGGKYDRDPHDGLADIRSPVSDAPTEVERGRKESVAMHQRDHQDLTGHECARYQQQRIGVVAANLRANCSAKKVDAVGIHLYEELSEVPSSSWRDSHMRAPARPLPHHAKRRSRSDSPHPASRGALQGLASIESPFRTRVVCQLLAGLGRPHGRRR